jgi:hypothetical protein
MTELTNMEPMMKRATLWIVVVAMLSTTVSIDATANARDPDGSRMQARQLAVGSSTRDRLNPPRDAIDWHYFKLRGAKRLSVSVNASPAENPVRVRVTNAVGRSVASATSRGGKATITRKFDPGVYYVSVSGGKAVSYTLSAR